jgi:RNA polymerase sigma factor (sigma-70 family)
LSGAANWSDEQIMHRVRAGDVSLVSHLFERHHRRLLRYCWHMTGRAQTSEDLVQEVFLRVLRHRETFREGNMFTPWLFSIARNAHHDGWRKRRRELPLEPAALPPASPGMPIEKQEELDRLQHALKALPDDQRELLIMHRFSGMSHAEIAEALGCEEGTSRARLYRALQSLRQIYLSSERRRLHEL